MKIAFSIRANKGGQQTSQQNYPANLKTLYLHDANNHRGRPVY